MTTAVPLGYAVADVVGIMESPTVGAESVLFGR